GRGAPEVQRFGNRHEITDVAQFHEEDYAERTNSRRERAGGNRKRTNSRGKRTGGDRDGRAPRNRRSDLPASRRARSPGRARRLESRGRSNGSRTEQGRLSSTVAR